MNFSSGIFLAVFLPLLICVYYLSGKKLRNYILLLASLVFYAWGSFRFLYVIAVLILVNYLSAILIERSGKAAAAFLAGTVAMNTAVLLAFKYLGFFTGIINSIGSLSLVAPKLGIPLGISFFTLQNLSYIIDVYRGKVKAQRSIIKLALYVCLFPKLVSGPVVRYSELEQQLESRDESLEKFTEGAKRFSRGLFRKAVFADTLGIFAARAFAAGSPATVSGAWLGAIASALQLYYDFSGYSDMALGLGKIFGFDFPENFDYPYASLSVREFWNRWHITLGTWFREYVYYPVSVSKWSMGIYKRFRKHFNGKLARRMSICVPLLVTWLLSGLWHGASTNFIVWGLFFALIIMVETLGFANLLNKAPKLLQHIYVLFLILISRILAGTGSLQAFAGYIGAMFGSAAEGFCNPETLGWLDEFKILLPLCAVFSFPVVPWVSEKLSGLKVKPWLDGIVYAALLITGIAFAVSTSVTPFIYAQY